MFGFINMNGRMFDPLTASFFSPDPYVQAPGNWMNYNRYAYCLNNPFLYTDPSGENPLLIIAGIGFLTGYLSHGISTNNWGMNAIYSGLFSSAAFTLGYASAGFSMNSLSGVLGHFSTSGAWGYAGMGVLNTTLSYFTPSLSIGGENFGISLSPIAMLTAGVDSSAGGGFRLGAGINAFVNIGDWTLAAGLSTMGKGLGNIYAGFSYDDGYRGFSYYHNWYTQGGTQRTGTIGGHVGDWSLRWENDVLAQNGDRFRSNATEIGYKNYLIGTNVYTTDPGKNIEENVDKSNNGSSIFNNKFGTYNQGFQLSSPLYIGMRTKHGIQRIGYSLPGFGDFFQNGFHHLKLPFVMWGVDAIRSPNFQLGNYSSPYYQSGRYTSNSLY